MPRRDGTGPMGIAAMAGRALGDFTKADGAARYGAGRGMKFSSGLVCRRGFNHGFRRRTLVNQTSYKIEKDLLQEQKNILENRLRVIDKRLECL